MTIKECIDMLPMDDGSSGSNPLANVYYAHNIMTFPNKFSAMALLYLHVMRVANLSFSLMTMTPSEVITSVFMRQDLRISCSNLNC